MRADRPGGLRSFGETWRVADQGGFNRCDVVVHPAPGVDFQVKVYLLGPPDPDEAKPNDVEDVGVEHLWPSTDDGEGEGEESTRKLQLLDGNSAALARVPGLDPGTRQPGFANWRCDWGSLGQDYHATVLFDRDPAPYDDDTYGRPLRIGDRDARFKPGGKSAGGRAVRVVYRRYLNDRGKQRYEVVIVDLNGPLPPDQRCRPAVELAKALNLPPRG